MAHRPYVAGGFIKREVTAVMLGLDAETEPEADSEEEEAADDWVKSRSRET
jgi:hypothetical protein